MDAQTLLGEESAGLGPVARQSMKDRIAGKLAALIGSGALTVGDVLPAERDLAAGMGVSRETVRGALLILSTRGILSVVQGARTTVASADVGELGLTEMPPAGVAAYALDDVHEVRLLIEARVARLATERTSEAALNRLEALTAAQERAGDDPVRFLVSDREFHTSLYRACGNAVLADAATTLWSYQLDHRRRAVARPGAIATSIAEHRAILSALRARDAAAAEAAIGAHERRIYETTRALLAGTGDQDRQGGDTT